jgi:hypothetical protein
MFSISNHDAAAADSENTQSEKYGPEENIY